MSSALFDFLAPEIGQTDIATFAVDKVNLRKEHADKYREKVRNLRDHLDRYVTDHPDVGLAKMLLSGSLAKGSALKTLNDVDVAIYIKGESAPQKLADLLQWLVQRLQKTYHQIEPSNIYIDDPCVVIQYSDLKVDVAPIIYEGLPDWRGYLFERWTGKKILTSIPLHTQFFQKRKDAQKAHFVQVVRLLKWWVKQREKDTPGFAMRSFLVELLMAKVADEGGKFGNYHEGLETFFQFIQKTGLKERIAFKDNYASTALPKTSTGPIEIFDPVNPENNVASEMNESHRQTLVKLADKALDTLGFARTCQTKGEPVELWQEVMGPTFNA